MSFVAGRATTTISRGAYARPSRPSGELRLASTCHPGATPGLHLSLITSPLGRPRTSMRIRPRQSRTVGPRRHHFFQLERQVRRTPLTALGLAHAFLAGDWTYQSMLLRGEDALGGAHPKLAPI